MSTKYTLDHGESHHLFLEIFEPGKIYLRLDGAEFEASPRGVTVAIPADLGPPLSVGINRDVWWDDEDDRDQPGLGQVGDGNIGSLGGA